MRDALAGRHYVADYVQTLTHELKSPLSAIAARPSCCRSGMPEADRQRFVANIGRETQRIQELVDRMMELRARAAAPPAQGRAGLAAAAARGTGGQREASGARAACASSSPRATPPGSRARPSCCAAPWATCWPTRSSSRPTAARSARAAGQPRSVSLSVRDHGPGIPDYADERVFEKFYSLARPATGKKSTGLGLAFVKEIAELHHGRVTLRNADGGGALATLSLPRIAAPAG
jgi:two-component system sensor histidine kinase CreC